MTRQRYAREFGRRWRVELPRADIKRIVARRHVGESDGEIATMIRDRCDNAAKREAAYTVEFIADCVAYALACHAANRKLFVAVQTGSFR
jgi:hypothetical protein